MSTFLDTLSALGQQIARVVARIGRSMAHWAAAQSWGRLIVLAILALVAQSILTQDVLHWRDDAHTMHVTKKHAAKMHHEMSDDNVPDVHIGADGITVTHHRRKKEGSDGAAGAGPADSATPGAAPSPAGTVGEGGVVATAPSATGEGGAVGTAPSASGTVTPNPAGTMSPPLAGKDALTANPANAVDEKAASNDGSSGEDSHDDGEDDILFQRSPVAWLKDFVEGIVLLFIVYLIAAKIVMRQTAKSESRAAEAEASAEQAAATAAAAEASAEREALRFQLVQAQLQALQAQIEPHFLFNTLASVDYLIETDPVRASAMQKNLIQYLRAALPQMRDKSSQLGRETDLVRAYLEILKVRMEDRLTIVMDIPDGLRSAEFPPMMLQSLVENAIQHGVEPKAEGGEVRVSAAVVDGELEVRVADSGIGLQGNATPAGSGLGLQNIRERLALLYPSTATFSLTAQAPCGALAQIRVPYRVRPSVNPS